MNTATVIILFLSAHLITAQLNFEGNPLTEHTDYLAEESQFSERTARQQDPEKCIKHPSGTDHISPKETHQPGYPQKLYPVYSEDLGREVFIIQSGSKDVKNSELVQNTKANQNSGPIQNAEPVQNSEPIQNAEPVQNSEPIQNAEPVQNSNRNQNKGAVQIPEPEKKPRQLQDNFINSNAIQQEQSYQQRRINSADLALQMFLNSKTQKESEVALNYYLQGGQGLAEKLELEKQQQQKLKQKEQMRQQQIQLEQMRQKQIQEEQIREQQVQQEQIRQQQIQQEQMRQTQLQQIQQEYLQQQKNQPLKHLEQQQLNHDQVFRQQNLQPEIPQNQQVYIQNQLQNQQQILLQNQQQVQPQQPDGPLPQSLPPQVPGSYPYPQVPFLQPRSDFYPSAPIYRRPMRRQSHRQPIPLQSRIGPGLFKAVPPPPMYPGKMIKPPVEIIYSRPPAYARGAPVISGPPGKYEHASPWFPESDHQPPAKDIYYSQLYAQSYDPHYYNYIAKTGKIKPHLYGKLNPEENQNEGILAELFRGFKNHGIKNIMNPTFLLGMTIPALTFMLTALVQKRSLARSDSRSFDQGEIREYLERLQRALECHRNSREAPTDDRCWR